MKMKIRMPKKNKLSEAKGDSLKAAIEAVEGEVAVVSSCAGAIGTMTRQPF